MLSEIDVDVETVYPSFETIRNGLSRTGRIYKRPFGDAFSVYFASFNQYVSVRRVVIVAVAGPTVLRTSTLIDVSGTGFSRVRFRTTPRSS